MPAEEKFSTYLTDGETIKVEVLGVKLEVLRSCEDSLLVMLPCCKRVFLALLSTTVVTVQRLTVTHCILRLMLPAGVLFNSVLVIK